MKLLCLALLTFLTFSVAAQAESDQTSRQSNRESNGDPVNVALLLQEITQLIKDEKFQEAYGKAKVARFLSQLRRMKAREAHATNLMAVSAMSLGRVTEAIPLFRESANLANIASNDAVGKMQLTALERAARLSRIAGRYEDSFWCLDQALRLSRRRNNRLSEVNILSQISLLYSDTGDYEKAAQFLQNALPMTQRLNNPVMEKSLLTKYMILEKGRGNLEAALQYGERAVAIALPPNFDMENRQVILAQMEMRYHLGMVYAARNQHDKAIEMYQLALQRVTEFHIPQMHAFALGELAWSRLKTNDAKAAVEATQQSLELLKQGGGNKHFESRVQFIQAEAQRTLGNTEDALTSYRQAIAALEEARLLSIPTEISRAGLVASRHNVFAGAIDLLLSKKLTAEALDVAESYHARAFLDVLTEAGISSSQELSDAQKAEETAHFEQIASIQKELWKPDIAPNEEASLNRKLSNAEAALETFRLKARRANPNYRNVASPPLIKATNIAKELLTADTAMIEFVLSEKKSFAWVIHRDKLVAVTLPPSAEIETMVSEYRNEFAGKINSLTAMQAIAKQKAQGQKLYQKLFQPLETHLTTAKNLVIVPDGALAYLPFETLATTNAATYLIERFAISYAPSASALAAIRTSNPTNKDEVKGMIAFGDPIYTKTETVNLNEAAVRNFDLKQLPYTRTEVNEIAALFPATERRVLIGTDAQERMVKTEPLHQYRYVHFAAHSNVDEEHPGRSGIILTMHAGSNEDGVLQMSEVMRLKLNADLVTLSACRTGLGKLLNGEGMIGLTRSFFYAGAKSVVVSLWNVNDIATASLMKSFYKHLQQGKSKEDALQAAKLELLKGPQRAWRHPYYWAAFVLAGDH